MKKFYNILADERNLAPATIDNIHTVLHQVLALAVDDEYIRNNPSDNALKELKQSHSFKDEKKFALTLEQENLFLDYLKNHKIYNHWYPIFAVMLGTGMRVGEICGLRWCDINFDKNYIDVNHTLVYYKHSDGSCYYDVHDSTKTVAGMRLIPMLDNVREAFLLEKEYQKAIGLKCVAEISGYTDFIFLNQNGNVQQQGTLNKAIRRITRDCNDEILLKNPNAEVLLPHFSCHTLRHSFATRMLEAGVNIKVMQDTLGHKDISTTLDIYADVTKKLKQKEFENLEEFFKVSNKDS